MVAAQLRRERPGVDGAQMEIEQERVDPLGGESSACLVGRPRLGDAVAVQLEVDPAEEPDRGVVINDEDGSGVDDRASLARAGGGAVSTGRTPPFPLLKMAPARDRASGTPPPAKVAADRVPIDLPTPTSSFRLRAWREFQRALDPLARPKRLPLRPR